LLRWMMDEEDTNRDWDGDEWGGNWGSGDDDCGRTSEIIQIRHWWIMIKIWIIGWIVENRRDNRKRHEHVGRGTVGEEPVEGNGSFSFESYSFDVKVFCTTFKDVDTKVLWLEKLGNCSTKNYLTKRLGMKNQISNDQLAL
jgi:hypothetical protein